MNILTYFQWVKEFADDCIYITFETHSANIHLNKLTSSYPRDFIAFLQVFNHVDLDGLHILSLHELLNLRNEDAVASDIPLDLLPFARDSGTADFSASLPMGKLYDGFTMAGQANCCILILWLFCSLALCMPLAYLEPSNTLMMETMKLLSKKQNTGKSGYVKNLQTLVQIWKTLGIQRGKIGKGLIFRYEYINFRSFTPHPLVIVDGQNVLARALLRM